MCPFHSNTSHSDFNSCSSHSIPFLFIPFHSIFIYPIPFHFPFCSSHSIPSFIPFHSILPFSFYFCRSLTLHRKTVVEESATPNHVNSSPTKSLGSNTTTPNGSPHLSTKSSPSRARRQAPPPPTQAGAKSGSAISSTISNHTDQGAKKDSSTNRWRSDNRLSLQPDSVNSVGDPRPRFGSLPRRTAPSAPSKESSHSTLPSGKPPKHPGSSSRSSVPGDASSFTTFSTFKSSPQSSHSQLKTSSSPLSARRYSADTAYTQSQKQKQTNLSASSPEGLPIRRTHSQASSMDSQRGGAQSSSPPRPASSSANTSPMSPRKHSSTSLSPSSSPRRLRASEGDVFLRVPQIELPTSFACSAGAELVENVRTR